MTFTIPDERLKGLPNSEREALMDVAIGLYKRDAVSPGRAAEVVGLRTPEFLNELQRRRIPINYAPHDLRQDLECLDKLH